MNSHFYQEDIQMAKKHEKMHNIREMQIKTTKRSKFISTRTMVIERSNKNKCWYSHYRKQYGGFSKKKKMNYHMIQQFHLREYI